MWFPQSANSPSRHAWVLLGGAFLTFSVSASLMHAYTVFLLAFIEEFGWTRAESSLAYSVSQFMSGISSPVVGGLVDRLGSRRMVLIGGGLLTAGLLASAFATSLWQVVFLYGFVMTMGSNSLGMVVFVPMISRHFVRSRGLAVSILQSANGFGRAFSAPVSQIMISGLGWRTAYLWEAGFMAVLVIPLAAIFRRTEVDASRSGTSAVPLRNWTLNEAMRTRAFWLLFLVYLLTGVGSFLVSLHQLAFAVDIGFDRQYAAWVLGMGAFFSLPGIIVTGLMSDYIGRELSAMFTYGVSILGVVFALFIHSPDQHLLLWLHACFFGLTWGARGPAITAKAADLFPGPRLGSILGVISVGTGLGAGLGSWGAGWIFDVSGSYRTAFYASISAYLLGCVAFAALRRPASGKKALGSAGAA
jgi:MFS family permease